MGNGNADENGGMHAWENRGIHGTQGMQRKTAENNRIQGRIGEYIQEKNDEGSAWEFTKDYRIKQGNM